MIGDLDARRRHWDAPGNRAPRDEHDLTDSLPYPFEQVEYLFRGKTVLEIGPGRGRQYERLKSAVSAYSIVDISEAALLEPVFVDTDKFLLCSYEDDLSLRFEVVHFWYVLHHVREDELAAFFAFVARHLVEGGLAIFNSPQEHNDPGWYRGDGMGTAHHTYDSIVRACVPVFDEPWSLLQDDRSSGYLFVARRRDA